MCDPVTATVVAGGLSIAGTVSQGYAQKQQGRYSEQVARYNARQMQNEAQQIGKQGVEAENLQRQQTAQLIGTQRAQIGASGVSLESGTPAQLLQDTATIGEADALRIRSNYNLQKQSALEQADLTIAEGRSRRLAGNAAFQGSLLSASGQAMRSYGQASYMAQPSNGGAVSGKWYSGILN